MDRTEQITEQTPESSDRFDRATIASMYSRLLQIETDTWDIYMAAGRKLHVTENELWILLEIFSSEKPFCQADLSRKLHLPVQTLNSALSKMTKKGWITLESIPGSQKSKGIFLTEAGHQATDPVLTQVRKAEQNAFESLGYAQAKAMLETIELYNNRFEKEMQERLRDIEL